MRGLMAGPRQLQVVTTRPRPLHEDFDVSSRNGATAMAARAPADHRRHARGSAADLRRARGASAEESIAWAIETFHPRLCFAVSFQKTSSVMIDIAHRIDPEARFFYLDTEVLFAGDLCHARRARGALRDRVRAVHSGHLTEEQARAVGRNSGREPDECCATRKVETMRRALDGHRLLGLGDSHAGLRDACRGGPQVRLGQAVRPLEAEPAGGLDRQGGLELHQ